MADRSRNPDPSVMPVARKRCSECLFSSAKIVSDDRRDEVLASTAKSGLAFQCHVASIAGVYIVCRGFYDAEASLAVRLARLLDRAVFVDLPEKP